MNYTINVLSPVHIGTGKKITPFEFALTEDQFVVIDLDRVLAGNPTRADELNRCLSQDALHFALSNFLIAPEINNSSFWKYSAALDPTTKTVLQEELCKARDMDVDECIKTTADNQVYLPGSSLKGAFRTALAYATFKANAQLFAELKNRLRDVDWRRPDEAVNELIFWGARNDPKYDLFKVLRLSDSTTLSANDQTLAIGKLKILSLTASSRKPAQKGPVQKGTMYAQLQAFKSSISADRSPLKQWWTLEETLQPGIAFTGAVHLEQRLLEQTPTKVLGWRYPHQRDFGIEKLLQAANAFAQDLCEWELNFFGNQVNGIDVKPVLTFYTDLKARIQRAADHTCYLCLGQGAGWHKMTLGMLLERDPQFDFRALRKHLRLAHDRLAFEYPKSRKLLMKSDTEIQGVFGWVEVQFM